MTIFYKKQESRLESFLFFILKTFKPPLGLLKVGYKMKNINLIKLGNKYVWNWLVGVITIKWANGDEGLKDYNPFCGHFHFLIEKIFGMKSFAICH
jgi:hypothetical protein